MKPVPLTIVARYCDRLLTIPQFEDWSGAVNGLQVANRHGVTRIAAAVDASLATIQLAAETRADFLLVHHGLFWSPAQPWTGRRYAQIQLLVANDLAVYSAHLPLDAHPRYGNNIQLCRALGFKRLRPFFVEKGRPIGWQTEARLARDELAQRLEAALPGKIKLLATGPEICRRVGVVTGGAGGSLEQAAQEGVDTFITGEGPHWTYPLAEELGINVFYGGHYATETFGVKALAAHLADKFGLKWQFVDHPSGL